MEYSAKDLPVTLKETDFVILPDGTKVRFEENGGARDVMIGEEFGPRCQLFEGNDYTLDAGGATYRLLAGANDLTVSRA
jgi:hypothetical protein